jgi:hypothetical protein
LAKPNYNQQKKQKELARQARQNEKQKKRQAARNPGEAVTDAPATPPSGGTPGAR